MLTAVSRFPNAKVLTRLSPVPLLLSTRPPDRARPLRRRLVGPHTADTSEDAADTRSHSDARRPRLESAAASRRYVPVQVHSDQRLRTKLDFEPQVTNADAYCGKVGFDARQTFCDTRPGGDLQRVGRDYMATGRAKDTGRQGSS